jgi:hypothetical protein
MPQGAPRPLSDNAGCAVRGARQLVWAALAVLVPVAAGAQTITAARFAEPTDRYAHGILGDAIEWGALEIDTSGSRDDRLAFSAVVRTSRFVIRLPLNRVFEDVAPRLVDVTGDGQPEVIVVETDVTLGASLAIYGAGGKLAATPYIGQRNRWLAPIGAADLDGDGRIEIAYIDRPHLAKTLRVWRYENRKLTEIASLSGVTNHRIGETDIAGGIRTCAGRPEMIVVSADWARLIAVTFDGNLNERDIGPHRDRDSFALAMSCD